MKNLLFITIYTLCAFAVQSQEKQFVNASSGLIIREEPSINADRIGKLPYGSLVELLETTQIKLQITDNGKVVNGVWVKVKFQNFPFIVSTDKSNLGSQGQGYVFSAFIEKLNKAGIEITEIDSLKFYSLYVPTKSLNTTKITSEKETESLLKGKVKWKDVGHLGRVIDEITLDNGQVLKSYLESDEFSFIGYYPTEGIIVYEGGHSSEFSLSIKTGESLETVGNPEYIIESPNKKLRLNGWFPGQECSSYFFQEKTGNNYTYLVDFGWGSEEFGENVCYFNMFYWLNDKEFMYSYTDYSTNENGREIYFKGQINKY